MKEKLNKFKNKILDLTFRSNKVATQLTIGISLIVFLSTLMIGLIFLSQYRQLSLRQTENELTSKSNQLAELGSMMLSSQMTGPRDRLFGSIKGLTDSDFWIVSSYGEVVISTTDTSTLSEVTDLNREFLSKIHNIENIITYEYSDYFDTKTLTVITPIVERNYIIGAVLIHKDVNIIYRDNTFFAFLVFASLLISLILSILLSNIYSRHFTKPLKRVTEVANEIAKQNYDIKTGVEREDELGELARTIDNMSSEINKNINEIKNLEGRAKELVANVSHEFKTPLTLIRGYVENLFDKTTKPSKEVYEKIISNTMTLEKLVNELLDLSKFQAGTVVLNKEQLELKQLINDVVIDMRNIAKDKKIKLKVVDIFKSSQIIEADYIKIKQLLTIFIDNAIKYSNDGSLVTINILEGEIVITDNGIGIEQSKLEQLFERYYQVDHNQKGYGLGLCIAKYIADAHDFSLVIDSTPNNGTSVHIKLKK